MISIQQGTKASLLADREAALHRLSSVPFDKKHPKLPTLPEMKLDTTFGDGGVTLCPGADNRYNRASAIFRDDDGSILVLLYQFINVSPSNRCGVVKLDGNGKIDTSFGLDGYLSLALPLELPNVPRQIIKYTDRSSLDSYSYIVTTSRLALGALNAYEWTIAKFRPDGKADLSFGEAGFVDISAMFDLEPRPEHQPWTFIGADKRLYLVLRAFKSRRYHSYVARFDVQGKLDTTFHNIGYYEIDIGTGTAGHFISKPKRHVDGKMYSYGHPDKGANGLYRFTSEWELDTSFGRNGFLARSDADISDPALAVVGDSLLVVGGDGFDGNLRNPLLLKYQLDGTLDPDFNDGKPLVTRIPDPGINFAYWNSANKLANSSILGVGRYVWGSYPDYYAGEFFAHLTPEGALDSRYEGGLGVGMTYYSLATEEDSMIVTGEHRLVCCGGMRDGEPYPAAIYAFQI
jgi:uncharacterized delta-60 repeat protein